MSMNSERFVTMICSSNMNFKQGVALTGLTRLARRVLPPGELRCICAALQTTSDADRRQTMMTDASDRY